MRTVCWCARPARRCNRRWQRPLDQTEELGFTQGVAGRLWRVVRTVICSDCLFRKISLTVGSGRWKTLPTPESGRPFRILFQYSKINYESLNWSSGWGTREDRWQNSILGGRFHATWWIIGHGKLGKGGWILYLIYTVGLCISGVEKCSCCNKQSRDLGGWTQWRLASHHSPRQVGMSLAPRSCSGTQGSPI